MKSGMEIWWKQQAEERRRAWVKLATARSSGASNKRTGVFVYKIQGRIAVSDMYRFNAVSSDVVTTWERPVDATFLTDPIENNTFRENQFVCTYLLFICSSKDSKEP